MGAWVLVSLIPPPPDRTVLVRRGPFMNDAAYESRWGKWVGLCQGRTYDMPDDPVEWWDPAADAVETYQAPAPIPQAESKGQMKFQF